MNPLGATVSETQMQAEFRSESSVTGPILASLMDQLWEPVLCAGCPIPVTTAAPWGCRCLPNKGTESAGL